MNGNTRLVADERRIKKRDGAKHAKGYLIASKSLVRKDVYSMKIYESWRRNMPNTVSGESITVSITYQSFNKDEIDEFEKTLPKGMIVMDTNKKKEGVDEI